MFYLWCKGQICEGLFFFFISAGLGCTAALKLKVKIRVKIGLHLRPNSNPDSLHHPTNKEATLQDSLPCFWLWAPENKKEKKKMSPSALVTLRWNFSIDTAQGLCNCGGSHAVMDRILCVSLLSVWAELYCWASKSLLGLCLCADRAVHRAHSRHSSAYLKTLFMLYASLHTFPNTAH